MVESYYLGQISLEPSFVRQKIQTLIAWENKIFGRNDNSNAAQTKQFIDNYLSFNVDVVTNPTLDAIKKELRGGRPVISLNDVNVLYLESNLGHTYHMLVIIGYDDTTQEFIMNDPARVNQTRFLYTSVMNSLHDFESKTQLATGQASVLFTSPK